MKNANMPAKPVIYGATTPNGTIENFVDTGLTKREEFAARAMQGILSSIYLNQLEEVNANNDYCYVTDGLAKAAVMQADALLEELEKTNE